MTLPALATHVVPGLCLAAAAASLAGVAHAQGDTGHLRGLGRTDVSFSYSMDLYDEFWVGSTKVSDPTVGEVTREAVNLHVAHGVRDDLDLVFSASWADAENDGTSDFDDKSAWQDAVAGVKWRVGPSMRLGYGECSFLLAPSLKVPLSHYETNTPTALGDGQLDWRARGIAHYRLDSGFFLSVESGFDYRTEAPANEIPLNVTLGIPVAAGITVMPFWSQVSSDGGHDIGQGDYPGLEEEWERIGVAVYARLDERFALSTGWKQTVDGRNTGDVDGAYWLGLVWKLGS